MADYSALKATIDASINTNGQQAITGAILNDVLNEMVDVLGEGYTFLGVATPTTNPTTPEGKAYYLAGAAGTYTNFGNIVVNDDEVALLVWGGTAWSKVVSPAASKEEVSQLAQEVPQIEKDALTENAHYILFEQGNIDSLGQNSESTERIRSIDYIPISGSPTFAYNPGVGSNVAYRYYDTNKAYLGASYSASAAYVRIILVYPSWSGTITITIGGVSTAYKTEKFQKALVPSDKTALETMIAENFVKANTRVYYSEDIELEELYLTPEVSNSVINDTRAIRILNAYSTDGVYFSGLIFVDASSNILLSALRAFATQQDAADFMAAGFLDTPTVKAIYNCKTAVGTTKVTQRIVLTDPGMFKLAVNGAIVASKKKVETFPSIKENSGKFISSAGVVTNTSGSYCYTDPLFLKKGDILRVAARVPSTLSAICRYNPQTQTYTPCVVGVTNTFAVDYEYEVPADGYYVASYSTALYRTISVVSPATKTITPSVTWFEHAFINKDGSINGTFSSVNPSSTSPFPVLKGDKVIIECAANDPVAALSTCNEQGTDIDPVILPQTSSVTTHTYYAEESGYLIVSCYLNSTHNITIIRGEDAEKNYDEKVETDNNMAYEKARHFFVDDARFIPDESKTNTIFVYDADNKVNTNHIVNAVAYPDGTIIAARVGSVVKIAPDGTETTLMTIAGASDWRGMFIDSNNNVYVSPHNTIASGASLSVSDRGLYRLEYGGSSFAKVIALYDTASSVPTETQDNDDTIWTMCEDIHGYLYAGVYAHSKRANPGVYRSTDGGVTWTYIANLINDGAVPANGQFGRAMHIHCIVSNHYNDALYLIVGEVNTIFRSTDFGETWVDLEARSEYYKGTTLIPVKDGVLVGSDGAYEGVVSKMYADDKTIRSVGKMWHGEFFGMRRSDLTGWIYAFTKIEPTVLNTAMFPPVSANTDPDVLSAWEADMIENRRGAYKDWQRYNSYVSSHYTHDSIHPVSCAILVSKDEGDTWEVIWRKEVGTGGGNGFYCIGYFKNGECLAGLVTGDGTPTFTNPIVISEGKKKRNSSGEYDLAGEIFIKTNTSNTI